MGDVGANDLQVPDGVGVCHIRAHALDAHGEDGPDQGQGPGGRLGFGQAREEAGSHEGAGAVGEGIADVPAVAPGRDREGHVVVGEGGHGRPPFLQLLQHGDAVGDGGTPDIEGHADVGLLRLHADGLADELLVDQRVHGGTGGAHGMALGLQAAREVDGHLIVAGEAAVKVVVAAPAIHRKAQRLGGQDLVDGEAVVHLGQVDVGGGDVGLLEGLGHGILAGQQLVHVGAHVLGQALGRVADAGDLHGTGPVGDVGRLGDDQGGAGITRGLSQAGASGVQSARAVLKRIS